MEKGKKLLRHELVESELLERAAVLFAERGFNGTTLQNVADTVGLTRAAFYHYFDSKEALLAALVENITVGRAAELKKIRCDPALTTREKLARVTRMMALNVATHAARFRLLLQSEGQMLPDLAAKHARFRRETLKELVELFAEGEHSGELRPIDPHLGAFALLGMCNWIAWWFKPDQKQTAEEVADQFSETALAAFGSRDGQLVPDPASAHVAIERIRAELGALERFIPPR